jgi:hypothetical protein
VPVVSAPGVLRHAAVFGLVLRDKTLGIIGGALRKRSRFIPAPVPGTRGLVDLRRDSASTAAVDPALTSGVLRILGVPPVSLIAENSRAFCPRLGHQRLRGAEFRVEFIAPRRRQLWRDRRSCALRAGASQAPVVGVTPRPEAAEVGSVGIA